MLLNERRESAIKHLSSFGHHQRVAGFWTYHGLDEQIREHYVFPLDAYDLVHARAHIVVWEGGVPVVLRGRLPLICAFPRPLVPTQSSEARGGSDRRG